MRAAPLALCGLLLAGCETLSKPWPPWGDMPQAAAARPDPELAELEAYADLVGELAHGDAAGRHAVYLRVAEAHASAPDARTALQLAAVLGAAGHADADPARADKLLAELEAAREQLPPAIAQLARQLRARQRLDVPERAADCEAPNRELRKLRAQLEDAERKIKALSAIERKLEAPHAPRPPETRR